MSDIVFQRCTETSQFGKFLKLDVKINVNQEETVESSWWSGSVKKVRAKPGKVLLKVSYFRKIVKKVIFKPFFTTTSVEQMVKNCLSTDIIRQCQL